MANTTSDSAAQQLRDEAAQHRRQATALEARAAALTELTSPDSVAGALDLIDAHAIRLRDCLRSDATPEAMSEMLEVLGDLRAAGRALDSRAGKVERKIRKLDGKGPSAASRAAASRATANRLMTPPPADPTVLDDPLTAAAAWLSAKEYAPSTVANVQAAMQRYVEISNERGAAPYEIDPREVLSVTQIKATTALFRWIDTHRAGDAKPDDGEAVDTATGDDSDAGDEAETAGTVEHQPTEPTAPSSTDTPSDVYALETPEGDDGVPQADELDADADDGDAFLREQEALMRRAVDDSELLPYTRIAIAAGIARIPPLAVVNLRHDQVSTIDGVATVRLDDDNQFTMSGELYEAMCEWSGQREGLLMVDPDGNRLAERAIGHSIGQALQALSGATV